MNIKQRLKLVIFLFLLLHTCTILTGAYSHSGGISDSDIVAMWIVAWTWVITIVLIFRGIPFVGLDILVETQRSTGIVLANMLEKCSDDTQEFICDQIVQEARHHPLAYVEIFKRISRHKYKALTAHCLARRQAEWEKGSTKFSHPKVDDVFGLATQLQQLDRLITALQAEEPGAHPHT